ncbi:hypothetical protein KTE71_13305 [Burkholderia multivorans]|nr:hypothetical protein [Burkholderia multivorans]MBU9227301.1 hypothetical protein [Burkholderia multivorans]MBU9388496.1 hypothetical protein [Burkholderia multivorans]HEF4732935.1 hypothetical protein [Burkholderia multivorans]
MLTAVGESVILVEVAGAGDYANCSDILNQVTQEVLLRDYKCNTERRTLVPDADGRIAVPPEALKIDPVDPYLDVTFRAGRLYDRANATDVFTAPVEVDVTLGLRFEDIPFSLQLEVVAKAARRYQKFYVGSQTADGFLKEDEAIAASIAEDAEADTEDYNLLETPELSWLRRRTFNNGTIN